MTRVLIVEDNPTLLENIALELELHDYQVMQADDGKAALQLLETTSTPPDIIVSDIAMPEMDGYALLEEVRKHDRWQTIPFIFLTAFDTSNAKRIGKELGVDDYLTKPFEPQDLIVAMENKLRRIAQIQDHAATQLDGTRQDLLNMIAHELRTPLTSIHGSTQMLAANLSDVPDEMTGKLLALLRSGTRQMRRLVNRIVYMVQIESGNLASTLKERPQEVTLQHVVEDIVIQYQNDATLSEVTLKFQAPEEPVTIKGVTPFIALVVDELIENAITYATMKHSEEGPLVMVNVYEENGKGIIEVVDNGTGISDDMLDRIGEYLKQKKRQYSKQNTVGMGLALVYDTVQQHGGELGITSHYGEGTRITVNIPLA